MTQKIIFIIMFVFAAIPSTMAFDKNEFVRDIEHAKSLAAQGKRSEAISYWERLKPKYSGAQGHYENELGNLYSEIHAYDKAEKTYLEGIALKGKYPRLYVGLAFVYLDQNRYTDAEKWAKRAVEEFPNWWLGYYSLGEIDRKQNNFVTAKTWLKKSLNVEPQAQSFWLLAIVSYELKEWQTVIDSVEAGINLDKTYLADENGMTVAAVSLAHVGRYRDAYQTIETLKKNNPKVKKEDIDKVIDAIKNMERQAADSKMK